jgi:para-nitrobenzyl esterase
MKRLSVVLILAAAFVLPLWAGMSEPIKVEGGLVSGTPGWGWGVREYRGIPYAAPPVGNLRWRPPQPVVPWQGVRAADRYSSACMQRQMSPNSGSWNAGLIATSEDCLYLNVWTPAASAGERLPVLVWIHGGGGVSGSSAEPIYDGNALAKRGVVVVSINYRLNVFAWFAHPELTRESDHRSSGNYGALDQVAALRWVKNNIAQFGGDPAKITMVGQSGGCRSVNWLAASPLAKDLVRAVIGESHTVMGRMTTLAEAESMGAEFGTSILKPSLAALRAMSAQDLLEATAKATAATNGAIVDGWFLPQDVSTIYAQGRQNDIALITGATNDEGGNMGAPAAAPGAAPSAGSTPQGAAGGGQRRGGAPDSLTAYTEWAKRTFGARADALLKLYPARDDVEARKAYHDVSRDINFAGHRTWAKLQATTGKAPVYLYMFSHVPPRPEGNGNNPSAPAGAVHFSEVIFVFDNLRMKDYPYTDLDRKVANTLAAYWTNFAKLLNPNGAGLPDWPVYNPKDEYWLNVGDTVRIERFNSAGVDLIASAQEDARRLR